jgi:Flp pilus assembly protein TadD
MTPAKSAGTFSKVNLTRPIALWGPAALAIFLYLPSLTFDRTFDDRFHVVPPSETPKQSLSQVWQTRYWGRDQGGGLYRPITTTTFWIEGKAHVPLPGRHMVNLLLYGAVTFLLVRLGLGLGMPPGPAGAAGVLFALHPVHVETVAGLVGRAELLAALTLLLALLLHARRLHGSGTNPFLLLLSIGVLAFLGAGAKENAWLLPLFALPLHLIYRRSLLVAWPAWLGYVLGIGSHLVLRHHVLGGWLNAPDVVIAASDNPLVDLHGFERLIAGVRVVGENVLHLTVPMHLAPDYSGAHIRLDGGGTDGRLWLGLGFLILTVLLFRAGLRSRNTTSRAILVLSGCWLFVSGLFFMNLFLDLGTILADRLLFWPSTAWAILLGSIPLIKTKSLHRALNLVLMGFAVFYAWGSLKYIPDWRNEKALFASAVRVVPESGRNWYNLGRGLEAEGHLDDALNAIRRARTLDQNDFQSWAQEGEILIQQGKWDDARAPIATALRLNPRDPMSLSNEGVIWLRHAWREQGDDATMEIERSAARFRDVLTKDPEHIEALLNLALAEGRLGHVDTSEVMWRRYIERRPQDPKALDNLAWLLATQTNRFQEAEALARRATALSPSDPKMQLTLAEALWNQGKKDEAAQVAAQGLSLHPQPPLDTLLQRLVAGRSATSPE